MQQVDIPEQADRMDYIPIMLEEIKVFSKKKRVMLKAINVIQDIVRATTEIKDTKERIIFDY